MTLRINFNLAPATPRHPLPFFGDSEQTVGDWRPSKRKTSFSVMTETMPLCEAPRLNLCPSSSFSNPHFRTLAADYTGGKAGSSCSHVADSDLLTAVIQFGPAEGTLSAHFGNWRCFTKVDIVGPHLIQGFLLRGTDTCGDMSLSIGYL